MMRIGSLNRRQVLRGLAACGAVVCSPGVAAVVDSKSGDDDYLDLFDGRTLSGWHTNRQRSVHGTGGRWSVEDGVLVGEQDPPGSGNGGVLVTDRKFADFELLIEMKPDWGPDSGVFLRCAEDGSALQMYVDYHENGNVGHLAGEGRVRCPMKPFKIHGHFDDDQELINLTTSPDERAPDWGTEIYESSCDPQDWLAAWRVGEWNTARIRCVGADSKLTTWINGLQVCQFDAAKTGHKLFDREQVRRELGREGAIGLQVHGGKAWPAGAKCRWRNIRIKPL